MAVSLAAKRSTGKVTFFRQEVRKWGRSNRREFPWRTVPSPYGWLMAEMMLRRTRANQVAPVYEAFMLRYPAAQDLVGADDREVSELLHPLGLTWRVPAFKKLAQCLVSEHGGEVPIDREALMALPGVGDYVAEAVRCFGFGQAVAIVDANTVRVAGRYFGFEFNPESRRKKDVRAAVARLLDPARPAESNLGLLDFAAVICQPLRPLCDSCPVAIRCAWRQTVLSEQRRRPAG